MELESLFQDVVKSFAICGNKVAVAVSGGMDSVALLHLMINWAKKKQFPLPTALTVDHALRSESKKEAEFAANYAKELGVDKSFVLSWERQTIKGNIQSRARKARYDLLIKWCKSNDVEHLLLAHHKSDQAETLLLRLERGSGVDGLSSMRCKSFFYGIYVLRPLLNFSRSEIEKYANFYQLRWIEDRSNQDFRYRRTLYRKLLEVSNNRETLTDRICLTAFHAKRAVKALMHYTRLAFNESVKVHDLGYIEIKLSEFHKLPEEVALRLLLYSIMVIGSKCYKPRYSSLIAIFKQIFQKDDDLHFTLCESKIRKYKESILVMREPSKIQKVSVSLPLNSPIEWDNRFSCRILGNQECSVTIVPLKKTHKIPTFLKDYNCCSEVFYSLPVVLKDEKILAYCHINDSEARTHNGKFQCITNSIIERNLVNLFDV